MDFFLIVPFYTRWHYTRGVRELARNWMDFIWFLLQFFSLGILFKTLFSPWERMSEHYGSGLNISNVTQTFLINTIMRIVGFLIRIVVIVIGLASIAIATCLGILLLVGWIMFPFVIFFLLSLSFYNFFK